MKRFKFTVSGLVQGVGFRFFTRSIAMKYNLKGYVKNEYDGSVVTVVEGDPKDINLFFEELKIGPSHSYVKSVKAEEEPYKGEFDKFEIRFY